MNTPDFSKEHIKPLFESKFIRVFDLQYAEGKHYYDATRRTADDLVAAKSTEEFKKMQADAVTCIVVLNTKDSEPKLLLSHEFRYPTGQFLLSPPAGLIDKEDADLITTATRELKEETGIVFGDGDTAKVISPLLFSTPGMTDESNALVLLSINRDTLPELNTDGAVGSECFNGFSLLTKEEARQILNQGTDSNGIYYSVYTCCSKINRCWNVKYNNRNHSYFSKYIQIIGVPQIKWT